MKGGYAHLSMSLPSKLTLLTKASFHLAFVPGMTERIPSSKHILKTLNSSLGNGGNGSHRRVTLANYYPSHNAYPVILVLGVGSTGPNQGEEDEDEEPEEMVYDAWIKLLDFDEEGNCSLKPWTEVVAAKANKINVALALREIVRRAWGECFVFLLLLSISNLSYPAKSGRRGRISWSKIRTDLESLIDAKFLFGPKFEDPTRMSLQDVTVYWKGWASMDEEGDPFSFFSLDDDSDKGKGDGGSGGAEKGATEEAPIPPDDYFSVDDDIPLPLSCETPGERTTCLQQMVPDQSGASKTFSAVIKLVDTLEVSPILSILSLLYLIQF